MLFGNEKKLSFFVVERFFLSKTFERVSEIFLLKNNYNSFLIDNQLPVKFTVQTKGGLLIIEEKIFDII